MLSERPDRPPLMGVRQFVWGGEDSGNRENLYIYSKTYSLVMVEMGRCQVNSQAGSPEAGCGRVRTSGSATSTAPGGLPLIAWIARVMAVILPQPTPESTRQHP